MRRKLLAASFACLPLVLAVNAAPAGAAATNQVIGVPAYFQMDDDSSWSTLDSSGGVAIVNEDNGPGTAFDPALATRIQAAKAAGLRVIGYVDTGWFGQSSEQRQTRDGGTSESSWTRQAEGDIDAWYNMYGSYGIDGIFFDDAWGTCDYKGLYDTVAQYARNASVNDGYAQAWIVDNPGEDVDSCYLSDSNAADTFVDFEGSYDDYTNWQPKDYELSADPGRLWNLVYGASDSQMASAMAMSRADNAGYIYVTDRSLDSNPWLTTASYLSDEQSQIGSPTGG